MTARPLHPGRGGRAGHGEGGCRGSVGHLSSSGPRRFTGIGSFRGGSDRGCDRPSGVRWTDGRAGSGRRSPGPHLSDVPPAPTTPQPEQAPAPTRHDTARHGTADDVTRLPLPGPTGTPESGMRG
ncbi:hypothetical protein SCATT_50230 [Streptantibioticus cattleyicolor NRRL 8057 = DSM 46488]|uniref:Uncharacterized protein n=1 Tax=Streptantibioticus cattleyicolor (strain ATCC 35852 / DSM 46488 / JCM 4925 / NBRC 14057 / NRRL 8057) TaxID=1003195 RepID=G8X3M0_STREN|nr:hypothetical protein SCATT_50230 [Streptantibioticus cattleyicolor NRRL 8057 = DSM 46488]